MRQRPSLGRRAQLALLASLAAPAGSGLLLAGAAQAQAAAAPPDEVRQALADGPKLQGQGRLRFLGLAIYDIRLWTAGSFSPAAFERIRLALEITYARSLVGRLIAERSLTEMRRGGPLDEATASRWLSEMTRLFPDVGDGDRLTGINSAGESAVFFHNGRRIGEVRDPRFTAAFFGIWLAPHTSEPGLRQQLLGGAT